jgi:SAM-dependent methyltransferase
MRSDEENLMLVNGQEEVDAANQEFYKKFPFPWPPMTFPCLEQPDFETVMLNQSIGDFGTRTIPADPKIWIAGCGTNQAIYTALQFPNAKIVGSDLSSTSLSIGKRTARSLGIANVELRQENLNEVTYCCEFDYIISTGVIHHNAEPQRVLQRIARALRPNGIIELMVYNRFHRTFTTAFQKAVRTITRYNSSCPSYDEELEIARSISASQPIASSRAMAGFRDTGDSRFADALIQPVEWSYTVESLDAMAAACGLELLLPCYNQWDHIDAKSWAIKFSTPELQARVDALPDVVRWQVTNLLLMEKSPMLWFYLRRHDGSTSGCYEDEVNERFLNGRFVRASAKMRNYVRPATSLQYKLSPASIPYPPKHESDLVQRVVESANGQLTVRQILRNLGVNITDRKAIADLRTQTTTSCCPYLRLA